MGYIQLIAKGIQDFNLVGNPQISFYKIVYRRYTNFSMETKELKIKGKIIKENTNVTLECEVKRDADLLSNVYFTFELPDIYSGCYKADYEDTFNLPYEFRWVENIGTNIIDNVKVRLNDSTINSYDGKFLQILSELKYDDSKKKIYDQMTGNIPELYNPGLFYKQTHMQERKSDFLGIITNQGSNYTDNTTEKITTDTDQFGTVYNYRSTEKKLTDVQIFADGYGFKNGNTLPIIGGDNKGKALLHHSTYPHLRSSIGSQYKISREITNFKLIEHDSHITSSHKYIPSIKKKRIKVPLNLFFSKTTGIALPLVALQYTNVYLEIVINKIKDLYTILDFKNNKIYRTKPTIDIQRFLGSSGNFDINPKIEAEYIFLDNDERKRFAASNHDYLIEDMHKEVIKGVTSSQDHSITFSNPVKEIIIVPQRSDMESVNNWNNYTNWTIENVPPYEYRYSNIENMYYSNTDQKPLFYNTLGEGENDLAKNFQMKYFNENIIENINFSFNGQLRLAKKDHDYFNLLQPYQHYKRKIKKGLYVYSFSLNPDEYQPSGACNFSRIDNFKINIDLGIKNNIKELPENLTDSVQFDYNFTVYAINYNILKISGGVGAKQYVS